MNPAEAFAALTKAAAAVRKFAPVQTESQAALEASRGDLREAFARRLGIPVLDRRVNPLDVERVELNRADARRHTPRWAIKSSYSRQLTRKVDQ